MSFDEKPIDYYSNIRYEILPLFPVGVKRVLEIGCGMGNTLNYLKSNGLCDWVCGVELVPHVAADARKHLDLVIEGDIEHLELPFDNNSIDTILCLDVLEHLIDPWEIIKKLSYYLKPNGYLIASIPNTRYYKIIYDLLFKGRWDYIEGKALDSAHLRFFVRDTAISLLEGSGMKIDKVISNVFHTKKRKILNIITFSIFEDFLTSQYFLRAVKPT